MVKEKSDSTVECKKDFIVLCITSRRRRMPFVLPINKENFECLIFSEVKIAIKGLKFKKK